MKTQNLPILPLDYEVLIPDDSSVKILSHIYDERDYTSLYCSYSKRGRKTKNSPRILFKILDYAASRTTTSSRELEECCKYDINYMWLLEGETAPDHNTFARFRTKHLIHAKDLQRTELISNYSL